MDIFIFLFMKSFILLENMTFYAYHGVFDQETTVGNEFTVSLEIEVNVEKSTLSDKIEDTVSYADVYDLVAKEMKTPSKLLEHLAKRIIDRIKVYYPHIECIKIKLSKRHPPLSGQIESAGIILIDN